MENVSKSLFSLKNVFRATIFLVAFFLPGITHAETIIPPGSNLFWNQTWTAEEGPYIIQGDIYVRFGTLTIEPGTVVKFMPGVTADIHADVNVTISGTQGEPVYFTSIKDDAVGGDTNGDGNASAPAPGDWGFVSFGGGSWNNNMHIEHLKVRYGGSAPVTYGSIFIGFFTASPTLILNFPWFNSAPGQGYAVKNIEVSHSAETGLLLNVGQNNSVQISNSSFYDNQDYGVQKVRLFDTRQRDLTGSFNMSGNWWGSATGPYHETFNPTGEGNAVAGTKLTLNDWLAEDPLPDEPQTPDPVIVIPGILGSWEKNGELVIDPVLHTYDDLINTFVLNGFELEKTIFTFPYEWRESNILTAGLLRNKINEVQAICECDKVDIVAHSMGGLVARYYIQSGLYEDDVDQLVFLATPHLGAPKAYLAWEGGEFGFELDDNLLELFLSIEARWNGFSSLFDYIQNQPIISVEQLLPTFDYLRDKNTGVLRNYPNNYPINTFLRDLNDDVSVLLSSSVGITNVVGNAGVDTISVFRVVDSPASPKWEHGFPENFNDQNTDRGLERSGGDKTVPLFSADFINRNLIEFNSSHRILVKDARSFVFETLTGESPSSTASTQPVNNVMVVGALSPVDIQVIAPDGSRIGKDFTTGKEFDEIPGAFYSGFETDNEFVSIPNPMNGEYHIVSEGTGSGGEYTIVAGYISEGSLAQGEVSSYILPGVSEEITVVVDSKTPENISVEETTVVSLEILLEHIEQAHILGWITNLKLKKKLIKLVEKEIKKQEKHNNKKNRYDDNEGNEEDDDDPEDNDDEDEQNKNQGFIKKFLKKIEKGYRKSQINDEGYNLLKEDVNNLE